MNMIKLITIVAFISIIIIGISFLIGNAHLFGSTPRSQGSGTVRCIVLNMDNSPVTNATITLWSRDIDLVTIENGNTVAADFPGNPQKGSNAYSSNGTPMYVIGNVPPGNYTITAEKDGIVWNGGIDMVDSGYTSINVITADTTKYSHIPGYSNISSLSIYGYVMDPGYGVADAEVTLESADGANSSSKTGIVGVTKTINQSISLNDAGFYWFNGIPPGSYVLISNKSGVISRTIVDHTGKNKSGTMANIYYIYASFMGA